MKLNKLHHLKGLREVTAAFMLFATVFAPAGFTRGLAASPEDTLDMTLAYSEAADKRSLSRTRLTKEERARLLAMLMLRRAQTAEPRITRDLQAAASHEMELTGLENRIKGEDSLTRKIISRARENNIKLMTAADGIGDVLRYTFTCSIEDYSQAVPATIERLQQEGYKVQKFRNAWGGKFYQGINVQFRSPEGVRFEMQFHTPQSYRIKQASHEVYEIRRNPSSTAAEVEQAIADSLAYNALVVVPEGASEINFEVERAA